MRVGFRDLTLLSEKTFKRRILCLFFLIGIVLLFQPAQAADLRSAEQLLKGMTVDQKIGQVLMVGFNGTTLSAPMRKLLTDIPAGGFILFRHNLYKDRETTKALTRDLENLLKNNPPFIPPFVAVDLEGGVLKRFPKDIIDFPSTRHFGETNDPEYVEMECRKAARLLKDMGINMNLAPVLEPCSAVMTTRAFGCDVDKVAQMGVRFIRGFQSEGIIATGKHFPGNAGVDQHKQLGSIDDSLDELRKKRFPAYEAAVKEGVAAVMISHVYLSAVDPAASATLSRKVIEDVLRKELKFKGVVVSDDLLCASEKGMVLAPLGPIPEMAVRAFSAGVDILLVSDANYARRIHGQFREALHSGLISEERLDQSVLRILRLKDKFNIP